MYTGFGGPVDPEVQVTKPGALRKAGLRKGGEIRGSGSAWALRPSASPALVSCPSAGARKRGVRAGIGGEVRQVLGSGERRINGRGRLESAKKSAMAWGWLARTIATESQERGSCSRMLSAHADAIAVNSSGGKNLPLKKSDVGPSVSAIASEPEAS
jgi:hypothetical protein